MKPNDDKTFNQRREELLKSRLITDNGNQSSQYFESLIEDVVLNGVSFDNQLPIFMGFAENEGLDANQLKNDIVILIDILKSVSGQPSRSEKMGIVFQAQRCHISEEVILRILSEMQEKKKQELPPVIRNLISNMVHVEGGTFMMGATSEQDNAYYNEKPVHRVTLSSFSIGRYQVTQEEWEVVMGDYPSEFEGDLNPVENVSWDDCQEFIRKLNTMTGMKFRLPTEAEWEFAARGGNKSKGYKYSGSNNIDEVAWYKDNSDHQTHPVGTKKANELGVYDMSGNVGEWCEDWYGDYSSSAQTNPKGPNQGSNRVLRVGSWEDFVWNCRVSTHRCNTPDHRCNSLGFRLAL